MPVEKPLHWVGSAKDDFLAFPDPVKSSLGYALGVVQLGGRPPSAKSWKGLGPGILELVDNFSGDTFRAVYAIRFEGAV
jgi:phage-related protein